VFRVGLFFWCLNSVHMDAQNLFTVSFPNFFISTVDPKFWNPDWSWMVSLQGMFWCYFTVAKLCFNLFLVCGPSIELYTCMQTTKLILGLEGNSDLLLSPLHFILWCLL
jgi:hypothetical protein